MQWQRNDDDDDDNSGDNNMTKKAATATKRRSALKWNATYWDSSREFDRDLSKWDQKGCVNLRKGIYFPI